MSLTVRIAIALAILAACAARAQMQRVPLAPVAPSGRSEEAECLRATLQQASASDRKDLGKLYLGLAKAIETGLVVKNTEQLMVGTSNAIDLAFGGRKLIPSIDVGAQVDAVVAVAIGGADSMAITDANRALVAKGLRDVAWACGEAQ